MTLAEAFMERKDIQKKMDRVSEELQTVLVTEEGQETSYTAKEKEIEVMELMDKLLDLNIKIDKANINNQGDLQTLRIFDKKISMYKLLRSKAIYSENRKTIRKGFSSEELEIKMVKNLKESYINSKLEDFETKRRELDRKLQRQNWKIEI